MTKPKKPKPTPQDPPKEEAPPKVTHDSKAVTLPKLTFMERKKIGGEWL